VPRGHVVETSSANPEQVLEAARDFTDRRAELWRDVYTEHLTVHDRGETWADVTEGNRWPIGLVWERLHYDWSEPDVLKGTVVESNIFKAGSTWEIRATRPTKVEAASRSSAFATCEGGAGSCGRSSRSGWRNAMSRITFGNS
jgi:hypothetical protein